MNGRILAAAGAVALGAAITTSVQGQTAGACLPHCVGDVSGDGQVTSADLIEVILSWGPCLPAPCPADVNGDEVVDVQDLVGVITGWGICTVPANDLCADADRIWPQEIVSFCTDGANTDGPPSSVCMAKGSDQLYHDLWYRFIAPTDGVLSLNTVSVDFDTRLQVYQRIMTLNCGCPGTAGVVTVGCNDDIGILNERSRLSIPVVGQNCYTVRVGGYSGDYGTGSMQVDWDWAIPINSSCGYSCIEDRDGTTVGFSGPGDDTSCGYNDDIDLWFAYTVNCNTTPMFTTISTCNPGTNFDTTLAVFVMTASGLEELACNDDYCGSGSQVTLDYLSEGQTYYIRLSGYNGASGNYSMTINTQCVPG